MDFSSFGLFTQRLIYYTVDNFVTLVGSWDPKGHGPLVMALSNRIRLNRFLLLQKLLLQRPSFLKRTKNA